ncbi:hypothetical protein [Falsiroseomonas selenitidurans]|uniref:Uncharacterized protein n=1 Tax=Falsiroseomonas selenitidurans TaxID=2716335 RepID=A0ABX1E6M1_9PROT|nr:hypothetical protein [Falsiroseomonas selenitidurans]NKC32849.1 hypothetical protein [Falsiroseomonas selenitidurans]
MSPLHPVSSPRPAYAVLASAGGLVLWALHFTALYAINAFACERGYEQALLFGLPWVPTMVGLATIAILLPLGLLLGWSLAGLGGPVAEGGEAEPRFTRWFAAAAAAYALLAVLFQAAPALLMPACGVGY